MAGSAKAGQERFNPAPIEDPEFHDFIRLGQYRRGAKDETWSAVLSYPDGSKQIASVGRGSLVQASLKATRLYIERRALVQAGVPLKAPALPAMAKLPNAPCFNSAAQIAIERLTERYNETLRREGSGKANKYNALRATIRRVLLPAFETVLWPDMADAAREWVHSYRLENGDRPSQGSVGNSNHALQYVNAIAQEKGWLKGDKSTFPKLSKKGFDEGEREAAFTNEEIYKIAEIMQKPEWLEENYSRNMILRFYVMLLASAGLRPGLEATSITESAIAIKPNGIFISVRANAGKYKQERLTAFRGRAFPVEKILRDFLQWRKDNWKNNKNIRSTSLCANPATGNIPHLHEYLRAFLVEHDLLLDARGDERVPYSFRHTAITSAILDGTQANILAMAFGTSQKMIDKYYNHATGEQAVGRIPGISDVLVEAARLNLWEMLQNARNAPPSPMILTEKEQALMRAREAFEADFIAQWEADHPEA